MTQVAEKLLEYMQSEYESQGTTRFTAQGIFLESNIDFGVQKTLPLGNLLD